MWVPFCPHLIKQHGVKSCHIQVVSFPDLGIRKWSAVSLKLRPYYARRKSVLGIHEVWVSWACLTSFFGCKGEEKNLSEIEPRSSSQKAIHHIDWAVSLVWIPARLYAILTDVLKVFLSLSRKVVGYCFEIVHSSYLLKRAHLPF
jgi:hypothetical protein